MYLLSALAIGFFGSFHCVAMCGPIVLALTSTKDNYYQFFLNRMIYNSGRIVTYSILGFLVGAVGHSLLLAGFQKSISISIGVLMIISVIIINYLPRIKIGTPLLTRLNRFIKSIFSSTIAKRNKMSLLIAGLANGVLPCGFVLLALAGASATQNALQGSLYMTLFGLGTVPAMIAVAAFGKIASLRARMAITKYAPIAMILLGLLLIYRGVNMEQEGCPLHQQTSTLTF